MPSEPSLSSPEIMVTFCNYWYAVSFVWTEGKDNDTLDVYLGVWHFFALLGISYTSDFTSVKLENLYRTSPLILNQI